MAHSFLRALAGVGLLLPACAAAPAERSQPIASGKEAFVEYCASCHGETGGGDGPAAGALSKPPADLRRIAARRGGVFPKFEIQRIIDGRDPIVAHGPRDMPIWGHDFSLTEAPGLAHEGEARGQIQLIVEYLETIQIAE
jgi:mono/diheme cytochrome c family protein